MDRDRRVRLLFRREGGKGIYLSLGTHTHARFRPSPPALSPQPRSVPTSKSSRRALHNAICIYYVCIGTDAARVNSDIRSVGRLGRRTTQHYAAGGKWCTGRTMTTAAMSEERRTCGRARTRREPAATRMCRARRSGGGSSLCIRRFVPNIGCHFARCSELPCGLVLFFLYGLSTRDLRKLLYCCCCCCCCCGGLAYDRTSS